MNINILLTEEEEEKEKEKCSRFSGQVEGGKLKKKKR